MKCPAGSWCSADFLTKTDCADKKGSTTGKTAAADCTIDCHLAGVAIKTCKGTAETDGITCQDGYSLHTDGKCLKCDVTGCGTCTALTNATGDNSRATQCATCKTGFFKVAGAATPTVASPDKCTPCADGCFTCAGKTATPAESKCTAAKKGYKLSGALGETTTAVKCEKEKVTNEADNNVTAICAAACPE